jgi:hypothetical protein
MVYKIQTNLIDSRFITQYATLDFRTAERIYLAINLSRGHKKRLVQDDGNEMMIRHAAYR